MPSISAHEAIWQTEERASGVHLAIHYSGDDLGAQINSAIARCSSGPGVIWISANGSSTTISTAITTTHKGQVLHFGPGTFNIAAHIDAAHIQGSGYGRPYIVGNSPTILKQSAGANLSSMIRISEDGGSIRDVEIDGNKANNSGAADGVICLNRGTLVENVFLHDCKRHGFYWTSTSTSNNSAAIPTFSRVISYQNGGIGFVMVDLTDPLFENQCEAELNGSYGIQLSNCPGARIRNSDVAQNTDVGLYVAGTTGNFTSRLLMVTGTQFGQNFIEDILIQGHDGTSLTGDGALIVGNTFWSGANRPDGTKSAIILINPNKTTITGNVFDSVAGTKYLWGIQTVDAGNTGTNKFEGNVYQGTFAGGTEQGLATKNFKALMSSVASITDCPIATYSASNVTTDRTYDADATTTAELADVLGTLIADLRSAGIIS